MINFGGRKKKTTFCVRIFDISPCAFTQILSRRARWMWNLIPHPMSTRTAYFWRTPLPQKKKYLKKHHHHIFSGISCFWGIRVRQKYAVRVLVGCGIKFCIQLALPLIIWVKTQGDMSKIRTKKVVFLFSSSKINKYYFNDYFIIFLRRPILSWNFL